VDRVSEEKWLIGREGMKSGNVSVSFRGGNREGPRIRQPERTLGRKSLEIEILKKRGEGVNLSGVVAATWANMVLSGSCHSQDSVGQEV
jgi:hypothetical protein